MLIVLAALVAMGPLVAVRDADAAGITRVGSPIARQAALGSALTPASPVGSGSLASGMPAGPPGRGGGLADNGLRSPQCRRGASGAARAAAAVAVAVARDCQITGLAFAQAPIGHYNFDVYADTSLSVMGTVRLVVQEMLLTPIWTALVWLVHAVAVALEWCFSIDLLDSATAGPIAFALRSTQRAFSDPWLAAALAVSGVAAAYRGLVQRRVADTLAEAAALTGMIVVGLWVIADPAHTIGALDTEVNAASLGAVAAFSSGDPGGADGKLEQGLAGVFAETIQAPWCYLEFGDVGWCREQSRLDPRLRAVAQRMIARGPIAVSCGAQGIGGLVQCGRAVGDPAEARREVVLLSAAHTNGDIFLAFPNDVPLRNSVTTSGSLLAVLCGSSDLATCQGATVAQAQFRGSAGTWQRAGGLLFITLGAAGMLAMFAFLALRLLGAALLTVFYLLLAPVAVLSPAFGEAGRAAFRAWAARLGGALGAKLLYSVLLGAALLMMRLLASMSSLGWWTEWLLVAAFWWLVFIHRHRLLELGSPRGHATSRARVAEAVIAGRALGRVATWPLRPVASALASLGGLGRSVPERRPPRPPAPKRLRPLGRRGTPARGGVIAEPASLALDGGRPRSAEPVEGARDTVRESPAGLRDRAQRLQAAALRAHRRGDRRAAARAGLRASGLLARADRADATTRAGAQPGGPRDGAWLDQQIRLRRGVSPGPRSPSDLYRDYARLAPLAGITAERYAQLDTGAQRRARLAMDRELQRHAQPTRSRAASDAAERRRRQFGLPGAGALRGDGR